MTDGGPFAGGKQYLRGPLLTSRLPHLRECQEPTAEGLTRAMQAQWVLGILSLSLPGTSRGVSVCEGAEEPAFLISSQLMLLIRGTIF